MRALDEFTDCGLPGVRRIPYGVHMCSFYRSREQLSDTLVPFFSAGLRARDCCIWVTAPPLHAGDALQALCASGVDAEAAVRSGHLVVRDHSDWYAEKGSLLGNEVVELWLDEERRALGAGYAGLRITGNVTFLRSEDWPLFMEYEALVDRTFRSRRIVTLCTYQHSCCGASEMMEVMRRHAGTLERPDEGWQLSTHAA